MIGNTADIFFFALSNLSPNFTSQWQLLGLICIVYFSSVLLSAGIYNFSKFLKK
jgi:hypothetical protein